MENRRRRAEIYLEDEHPQPDIIHGLAAGEVANATLSPLPGQRHAFTFTGDAESDRSDQRGPARDHNCLHRDEGLAQHPYRLMTPVPESSFVGAQVGGELRDKAVQAVLLSSSAHPLFAHPVRGVRLRPSRWSCRSLHDVLIALGALAVACWTHLLQAELDLAMIAAFLTIIGYSQNDHVVIFDRVRENLPKSKKPLWDVLNDSINETLGRTVLTTATVLLTLLVLFFFNVGSRNVLEGFLLLHAGRRALGRVLDGVRGQPRVALVRPARQAPRATGRRICRRGLRSGSETAST